MHVAKACLACFAELQVQEMLEGNTKFGVPASGGGPNVVVILVAGVV